MPRPLSAAAVAALNAQETGEVFLMLLTISHAALAVPLRFVQNSQNVTRLGETYLACPFQVTIPPERDDQIPSVELVIDNVDRRILEGVRQLTSPPTIMLEVVLASSPDTLEAGPFAMSLRNVEYDAITIRGVLTYEDVLNEPFPQYRFTPNLFPGLF